MGIVHISAEQYTGSDSLRISEASSRFLATEIPPVRSFGPVVLLPLTWGELTEEQVRASTGDATATVEHRDNGWTIVELRHVNLVMKSGDAIR